MRRIRMKGTRKTRAGVLKKGKNYPVPEDVAGRLVEDGVAFYLDADKPETATVSAGEDAAARSHRPRDDSGRFAPSDENDGGDDE